MTPLPLPPPEEAEAAREVASPADLSGQVSALLGDPQGRQALAAAAAAWSAGNGGAVGRTLDVLRRTLAEAS